MLSLLRKSKSLGGSISFIRLSSAISAPNPKSLVSSCQAGNIIKGLNIRKGQDPIIALADGEYPEWLWSILDKNVQQKKLEENPLKAARKARRQENRRKIKENNFLASMSK